MCLTLCRQDLMVGGFQMVGPLFLVDPIWVWIRLLLTSLRALCFAHGGDPRQSRWAL